MIDRQTGRKNFESMPICVYDPYEHLHQAEDEMTDVRIGMHLLFVDGVRTVMVS